MGLYLESSQPESDASQLATEARKRITELSAFLFQTYCQLENYEKNNTKQVSSAAFQKAIGSDQKDFASIKRRMKRLLVTINPAFKEKLATLIPKTRKAAR